MNGSLDSEFRRSLSECAAKSRAREAELTPPVDLAHPGKLPCAMCGAKGSRSVFCEQREGIWEVLCRRDLVMFGRREHPVLCKQCCIAELDGHHCAWWGLCWC